MVAIDEAFTKEGIVIPFPQRDLHLKSGFTSSKSIDEKNEESNE
jgi:small-conductance mechanosensitive channel